MQDVLPLGISMERSWTLDTGWFMQEIMPLLYLCRCPGLVIAYALCRRHALGIYMHRFRARDSVCTMQMSCSGYIYVEVLGC
jgi:hypothetical protein